MRTWAWLFLGLGGCFFGGSDTGGETTDEDTTDNDDDDNDDDTDDICRDVNNYDVSDLDPCDQTWTALTQLAYEARYCLTPGDCWAADPQCEDWVSASCYVLLNHCVKQSTIQEFADHGHCTGDNSDTCSGCPSPPDIDCVNGVCTFLYE